MNPFYELDIFLNSEHAKQFPELCTSLLKKSFTATKAGITHRWITYWDKHGLLFSQTEKDKWRKFNFIEYVWLRMIVELRKYTIPIQIIRDLKNTLLRDLHIADFLDSNEVIEIAISRVPDRLKKEVREYLTNKEQVKKDYPSEFISMLMIIVLDAIILKSHFALLVNQKGEFCPFKESYIEKYQSIPGFYEFIHNSYISISITQIICEFIKDNELPIVHKTLALLTDEEAEILRLIRAENLSSLRIRFDKEHKIDLVELSKQQKIDKEARFVDLIMSNGYQDIEIKTENGKIVFCENTRKIKIKNE